MQPRGAADESAPERVAEMICEFSSPNPVVEILVLRGASSSTTKRLLEVPAEPSVSSSLLV